MKLPLLVSLLMLFLLVEAQGAHLKLGFLSLGHQKIHEEKSKLIEVEASGEVVECRDGKFSGGRSRKLLTDTISTTSTISTAKILKNEGTKSSHNERPNRSENNLSSEQYPDIIDIAGMDYSTAKRKAPIHN